MFFMTSTLFSDICSPPIFQGDEELAIDVMDRLSSSVLESFIHLTGADQVKMPGVTYTVIRYTQMLLRLSLSPFVLL